MFGPNCMRKCEEEVRKRAIFNAASNKKKNIQISGSSDLQKNEQYL